MKRTDWTFAFKVGEVAEAAAAKARHHREREKHWQSELEEAQHDLKQAGTHFREHAVTSGKQIRVIIDEEKQNHVNLCASKIDMHQRKSEKYESFARALKIQTERVGGEISLDVSDVEFFGL